ncbi:MAG: TetR/AcrR family transcriptional regulator [Chloroflexi bacterium]|nr:TetR/AcrR family transcriptional regulator [Chloroflexota bacterium]
MRTISAKAPSLRQQRRLETRARLMEAAQSVFARQGYNAATIDEIVREAGFSKGAFYVHFASKEDLFWEMLEERIERQQAAFRQVLDPKQPMVENIERVLEGAFQMVRPEEPWPALVAEFAAHAARNEKVRERLSEMYGRWRAFLIELIEREKERGRVRADLDPEFAASLLIAVVEGSMIQARLDPQTVRLEELRGVLAQTLARWLGGDAPKREG